MPKNYNSTFIYNKFPYEKKIYDFLVSSNRIDKQDSKFDDIKYEFKKRQTSYNLVQILLSKKIVLLVNPTGVPLNTQFRVLYANDVTSSTKDYKVFIDCTGLIVKDKDGSWRCRNIDILICHIVNAMVTMIYHNEERYFMSAELVAYGMQMFSDLFVHVLDYLYKISIVPSTFNKCKLLASMYYVNTVLDIDLTDSYFKKACDQIGISEREAQSISVQIDDEDLSDINTFIPKIADIIKAPQLHVDNFLDKWMYLYGTNTVFALEYFPAFSAMITDAYHGAYINNQKTIEKVVGRTLVLYTKAVLDKGGRFV